MAASDKIFFGIPTYNGDMCAGALYPIMCGASKYNLHIMVASSSLLAGTFNLLWCNFLKSDCKYFIMLHSDIVPDEDFIETLMSLSIDYDIVSAVSPIKDQSGDTSTGMLVGDHIERIRLKDLGELPQTFGEKDVKEYLGIEGTLLLNTGCWIAKRGDWCDKFNGFSSDCGIREGEPIAFTEDWRFSVWAKKEGLKLAATQEVGIKHYGTTHWDA